MSVPSFLKQLSNVFRELAENPSLLISIEDQNSNDKYIYVMFYDGSRLPNNLQLSLQTMNIQTLYSKSTYGA